MLSRCFAVESNLDELDDLLRDALKLYEQPEYDEALAKMRECGEYAPSRKYFSELHHAPCTNRETEEAKANLEKNPTIRRPYCNWV